MVTISGAAGSRPRRRATLRGAVAMLLACAAPLVLTGATPTFWTVSTQTDFLKGEVENLSIDSNGRLFLGPPATKVAETAAPFLWTIVPAPDGALWAGTGNEGQVLKIARDGKVSVFFDAAELEVHALAAAPNGGLYVGTSPNGKIYEVAADGTSKTFFDPGDKYIWSLAVDRDSEFVERGEVEGEITHSARGVEGFGYDPYFESTELGRTFGEVSAGESVAFLPEE